MKQSINTICKMIEETLFAPKQSKLRFEILSNQTTIVIKVREDGRRDKRIEPLVVKYDVFSNPRPEPITDEVYGKSANAQGYNDSELSQKKFQGTRMYPST